MIDITKEYLEEASKTNSYADIAKKLNCDVTTLYGLRRKFGIEPQKIKGRKPLYPPGGYYWLNLKISNDQRASLKKIAYEKSLEKHRFISLGELVRDALNQIYFHGNVLSLPTKPCGIKWSEGEVEYLKENYWTKSNKDIAQKLNRTIESIKHKARRLGLTKEKEKIHS